MQAFPRFPAPMLYEHQVDVLCRTPLVSIVDFRCWKVEARCLLPEEAMRSPVVLFPRRGVFHRHGPGGTRLFDANHVLLFNRGEPFRISYPQPGGDDSTLIVIDPRLLREILAEHEPRLADRAEPRFPASHLLSAPDLFLAHSLLLRRARARAPEAISIEEGVVRLAGRVVASAARGRPRRPLRGRPATRRAHRDGAEQVKAILAGRFRERLTLDEIARAAGVSPYHLCRIFSREVGMPIHRYLNRLRLRDALRQVADRRASLTEVALDLGYSSHSHFSDAFRREFGISPSDFRRDGRRLQWLSVEGAAWRAAISRSTRDASRRSFTSPPPRSASRQTRI